METLEVFGFTHDRAERWILIIELIFISIDAEGAKEPTGSQHMS